MVAGVYLICKHDRISNIIAIKWSDWMSNKLDKDVRLRQTCWLYCIAENIGGRKHWWIWQIDGQSPKLSSSNLRIFNIRILFVGHSPKVSSPNNPNSWICQCFLPPRFSAIRYYIKHKFWTWTLHINLLLWITCSKIWYFFVILLFVSNFTYIHTYFIE